MAKLIHRTSSNMRGIWLFSEEGLRDLDGILKEERERLQDIRRSAIENAVRREKSRIQREGFSSDTVKESLLANVRELLCKRYPFHRNECTVRILFKSGKSIEADSIDGIMNDANAKGEIPTRLSARIECGEFDLRVSIDFSAYDFVSVDVTPEAANASSSAYVRIEQWASRHRLPMWTYHWRNLSGLQWYVALIIIAMLGPVALVKADAKALVRDRASQLLKEGITSERVPEAMGLLLKSVTGAGTEDAAITIAPWYLKTVAAVLVISLFFSFPPTSAIAIGAGVPVLRVQECKLKVVTKWFPAFMILGVLASIMGSLILSYVSGARITP